MLFRSSRPSEKDRASRDVMQDSFHAFRSYFRAPNGQLVASSLFSAHPNHAVMCRLKQSERWFVHHAYVDRQTAEDDVAKQRFSWEVRSVDHVIVDREMTDVDELPRVTLLANPRL